MSYVLINRHQQGVKEALRVYTTYKGALIGMRASNRNAGWTRSSRCYLGYCAQEWGHDAAGDYDYAPYAIMESYDYLKRLELDKVYAVAV